jgi:hypothetical protein
MTSILTRVQALEASRAATTSFADLLHKARTKRLSLSAVQQEATRLEALGRALTLPPPAEPMQLRLWEARRRVALRLGVPLQQPVEPDGP